MADGVFQVDASSRLANSSGLIMSRRLRFLLMLCAVIAICSCISHFAVRRLKIFADYGVLQEYGPRNQKAFTVLYSSSLGYSGIDWDRIAGITGGPIESWATAGSSPAEWEILSRRSPAANRAFVVISAYDLNEYWLCDFRADIVPLRRTVEDLWRTDADWPFCKRILSQYAVMFSRKLFPTIGRSDGVMTGIRDSLQAAFSHAAVQASEDPKFGPANKAEVKDRLTDWSAGRLQRRLVLMRTKCQGKHSFSGLKKTALIRLLQQANHREKVTVLVVPVSPIYEKEFLTVNTTEDFEQTLADIQRCCAQANLIRLDHISDLHSNDVFADLVHLNTNGQRIATSALLEQLENKVGQR